VGTELDFFASTYLPAYASIARTNVRSVERALVLRRLIIASIDTPNTPAALRTLREQFAELGRQTDAELALARARLAERLGRPGGFSDAVAVARLDTRLEQLSEDQRRYEILASKFLGALDRRDAAEYRPLLAALDEPRAAVHGDHHGGRRELLRVAAQG